MKTKQAVLVEPRRFEIQENEIAFGAEDVLVKMEGTGMCTSEMPAWLGMQSEYPYVMGHEGWGTIVDKGKSVSERITVGDRVTGLPMSCYSEYFSQPEWCTMKIDPEHTGECFLGEPYYCVNNVIRAAHPEVGDCVVLVGLGPMGQWALQGIASPVLHSVIAIDVDEQKLAFAKEAGATHAVNSKDIEPVEAVKEITGGRMADIVIEGTGVKAGMDIATQLLRSGPRPKLVVMSFFKKPIEIDITTLCGRSAEVICAHPGITADRPDHCRRTEIMINNGVFRSDHLVTHRYSLEDTQKGFEEMEERPVGYIKGVVTP